MKEYNVIQFSGGRTSAYMTKRLIDEGLTDTIVCFQNTGKESLETLDFVNECDKRWNLNIVWLEYGGKNTFKIVTYETASRNGEPFDLAIEENKALPNSLMRWCTRILKIETCNRYLKSIGIVDYVTYLGLRYDEPKRWMRRVGNENEELPLVKWKTTKHIVREFWANNDFDLMIDEPFGNCDLCFHKRPNQVKYIAKHHPEKLDWWTNWEKKIGKSWRKEGTLTQIINNDKLQGDLFEDKTECYCTID